MLRQKRVRIITSTSFFTERSKAPTMTFRPGEEKDKSPLTHTADTGKEQGGKNQGIKRHPTAGWNQKLAWPRILMPWVLVLTLPEKLYDTE